MTAGSARVAPSAGPPVRRRRTRRVLSWVAIGLSALLVGLTGAGYAALHHYDSKIRRLPGVVEAQERPAAGRPQNILIVGSDSREGLVGEEAFQGTGDEFVTGQRSDVIILAHVFGRARKAQLVSLPRDAYVQIPAYRDPKTGRQRAAQPGKLNDAFARGGPALLVQTVQRLTGVRVTNYVQVDFRGFKRVVNALGGVEVCLSKPQKDFRSGIDLPAGRQVVGGDQALAFVRQRQGLARGDIDRIQRQQLLMGALVRKLLSAGTLLNPVKLNSVLQVGTRSLQVDQSLRFDQLRALAQRLRGLDSRSVVFTTAPVADLDFRRRGVSYVQLDPRASEVLFDRLRRDIPPPPRKPGAPGPRKDERSAADDPCA